MGDFYTLNFTLERDANTLSMAGAGNRLTFPTAPMYHNKETYSGKNRIWLKSLIIGGVDWDELVDDVLPFAFLKLELNTATTNSFALKCLPDNAAGINTANTDIESDSVNRARFTLDLKSKVDYGLAGDIGTYAVAGAAIATNDRLIKTQGVLGDVASGGARKNGSGELILGALEHYDTNFHPANAMVVGNLWGTQLEARMVLFSTQAIRDSAGGTLGEGTSWDGQVGCIHAEIVVEPLHNEPKQSHFSLEDEKNRQRF